MTFNPKHEAALEYLARIAADGTDRELAQRRVQKLLAVSPNHRWGRSMATDLTDSGPDKGGPRRFGFWKKD